MLRSQRSYLRTGTKGKTLRRSGFTLVEIIIVAALIGLLAAVALPNFIRSRTTTQKNACINNLKQIDAAIQQWAIEHGKTETATVDSSDIIPYLRGKLVCPAGGDNFADSYTITTVAAQPMCQRVPLTHIWPISAFNDVVITAAPTSPSSPISPTDTSTPISPTDSSTPFGPGGSAGPGGHGNGPVNGNSGNGDGGHGNGNGTGNGGSGNGNGNGH